MSEFTTVQYSLVEDQSMYFKKILDWCNVASQETDKPAAYNMRISNWEEHEDTLAYILHNGRRFYKRGEYFFLEKNGEIVAGSGIYRSDFDNNLTIGGVRSWVNPQYRAKFVIGRYLLPLQLNWAKENNYKTIALTFNDYNSRLINYFRRSGFGIIKNRNTNSLFYNGLHELSYQIKVKGTAQWAIYHKIDEEYEPNWEVAKVK
jgi:GNAT superfamily N-acetyltransferase